MDNTPNIEQDSQLEAAMRHEITAASVIEIRVEVLHHSDHEPRHLHVKPESTLLEVLDDAAQRLDVRLLPNPHIPLDQLRGIYEHYRVGEPLDLNMTIEEFLRQSEPTHNFGIELVLAIEVNTRWRIAPEHEMTPKAILTLADLPWEQYSLYYPVDSVEPLPPDTPIKLHRGERLEAQRDGKYGAGASDAHRNR